MAGAAGAGAGAVCCLPPTGLAPWLPVSLHGQVHGNALQRGDDEGGQLLRHTASPFGCHHGRVCSPTLRARTTADGILCTTAPNEPIEGPSILSPPHPPLPISQGQPPTCSSPPTDASASLLSIQPEYRRFHIGQLRLYFLHAPLMIPTPT
ncbi:hypothetical protein COCC4DRAFT_68007 [Bipolaris maydis ATCC 48331]|uniref:Uncharacterized protein n=2 Tax=Cochliobolus heterostrophus TaxID=5016 RepID=M2TFN9_COCH5|nr:uncharacterized protein COCC4DRAFT_68007 [Bipolaris maydis ATCC 48331]EMD96270.1 hypothetical protein COCHEDRAFT_1191361 [Bipolaris maydis C5]ENI11129.1 hypothetical protein COCC4DRAFT_68007 [Bipolaris maydis ATCC 48331]